jgi:hypothetical protein
MEKIRDIISSDRLLKVKGHSKIINKTVQMKLKKLESIYRAKE